MNAFRKRDLSLAGWAAVLAASLGAIAWINLADDEAAPGLALHAGHAHDDPDQARGRKALPHPYEELESVVLRRRGQSVHYLPAPGKKEGGWIAQVDGARMSAERGDASTALGMLLRMRMEKEYGDTPAQAREFGIDAASLQAVARFRDGEEITLQFGDRAPDGISRYARISPPGVLATVPDFHYRNLETLAPEDGVRKGPASPD